jgi:hypothetical protein
VNGCAVSFRIVMTSDAEPPGAMFRATIRQVEWSLVIASPAVPHDAPLGPGGGDGGGAAGGDAVVVGVVVVVLVVVVGAVVVVGGGGGGVGLVVGVVVVGGGGAGAGTPPKPWFGGGTLLLLLGGVTGGGWPSPGTGEPPWSGGVAGAPPAAAKLETCPPAACASCGIWLVPAPMPTSVWPPLESASWPVGAGANPPRSPVVLNARYAWSFTACAITAGSSGGSEAAAPATPGIGAT